MYGISVLPQGVCPAGTVVQEAKQVDVHSHAAKHGSETQDHSLSDDSAVLRIITQVSCSTLRDSTLVLVRYQAGVQLTMASKI